MENHNIVDLIGVSKYFEIDRGGVLRRHREIIKAVDRVSLSIETKKHLSIVGESGCGKTTLARMILGLETPTSGRIIVDGNEITKKKASELRPLRRTMQIVFQDAFLSLNPRMNVSEIVERPLKNLEEASSEERKQRVREALEAVGLANYADRIPSELSGGQRQRVAIARALSVRPKLMVLDEPTSALDISIQAQVLSLLREIQNNSNLTYILITHNISIIHYLSVLTAVMYRGKLVEFAGTQKLLLHPLHPYTLQLIASMLTVEQGEAPKVESKREFDLRMAYSVGCPYADRCPKVMDKCRSEEPKFVEIEKNHFVACFLYSECN